MKLRVRSSSFAEYETFAAATDGLYKEYIQCANVPITYSAVSHCHLRLTLQ